MFLWKRYLLLFPRLGWFLFIIKYILKNKPNVVHAIDFDSAFPAYLACRVKCIFLIYDIADYIETFDSDIPSYVRNVITKLSNLIIDFASKIIIPDQNRLKNIHSVAKNKIIIVNNAPAIDMASLPVNGHPVDKSKLNLIYYGAFNEDRGISIG